MPEVTRTFNKGLVTRRSPISRSGGLEVMENVWLSPSDAGAIEPVEGYRRVTMTGPQVLDSLIFARASTGVRMALVSGGGILYQVSLRSGDYGSLTAIKTGLKSAPVRAAVMNDVVLCFNGQDTPFKVTIAQSSPTVSDIGLTRPTVTNASTALNAGGDNNVRGTVSYRISQMSATTEGALSVTFGEIDTGDGNRVDINLTHADFGSNTYRVYRTPANGSSYRYIGEATGGTTFTDDVSDAERGDFPFQHGDQPPTGITSAVSHFRRVFGLDKNDLYWTDLDHEESWWTESTGNHLKVAGDDGDIGTVVVRDFDGLLIFKHNHLYRLAGRVPQDFVLNPITASGQDNRALGTPGPRAVTYIPGGVAFYWGRGVYLYQGGLVRLISEDIKNRLDNKFIERSDSSVSLGYDPVKQLLLASFPMTADNVNTNTFIYDLSRNAWVGEMTRGFQNFITAELSRRDVKLWALGQN